MQYHGEDPSSPESNEQEDIQVISGSAYAFMGSGNRSSSGKSAVKEYRTESKSKKKDASGSLPGISGSNTAIPAAAKMKDNFEDDDRKKRSSKACDSCRRAK